MKKYLKFGVVGGTSVSLIWALAVGAVPSQAATCQPGTPPPASTYPGTAVMANNFESGGLAGFTSSGTAQVYRYSAAKAQQIDQQADQAVGSSFSATFPAGSITLMVLPKLSVPLTPQVDLPLVRR